MLAAVAVPPAVVTFTVTVPATWGLVTALMVVALVTVKLAAVVVANFTELTAAKWDPEMVTVVPPVVGPEGGVIPLIVGAAACGPAVRMA